LAINRAEASLIRVEADELTYSLHIMVRYEIEKSIMEGNVNVDELPELWKAKMEEYLGIVPETDAEGVLQDVHWSAGLFGYFPSYAIGTAISAQIIHKMREEYDIEELLINGEFDIIQQYLGEKIHQFGKSKTPTELLIEVTGEELNPNYYCDYLEEKYTEIYDL